MKRKPINWASFSFHQNINITNAIVEKVHFYFTFAIPKAK
jgi:hypothetical protein